MNPTVKTVLLNERSAVLSAIGAREGTIADLLVQLNGVENDIWRLRHRLIDLEAYLIGHQVALPEAIGQAAQDAEAAQDPEAAHDAEAADAAPPPPSAARTTPDPAPGAAPPTLGTLGLPACKPLGDFVRPRSGKRRALADASPRHVENA
jgi:uncharacterized membrane protein